jgi:polysaccharide biosynthesis transport protein
MDAAGERRHLRPRAPTMKQEANEQSLDNTARTEAGFENSVMAGDENVIQRNLRDYVVMLRERVWHIVVVALIVFLAALFYTLNQTKLYTAAASIEILPREAVVMQVQEVRDSDLRGPEDLNTQVKILESGAIVQRVAERLSPEEIKALMQPYQTGSSGDPLLPGEVLALNRKVAPIRATRILQMIFTHPDPEMAAKMANYFVEEFMNYNSRWRVDESLKAVEELKIRADQQGKKVQELGNNLQAYRERNNMVSLDQRKDIVTEKLKLVSSLATQAESRLMEAQLRYKQVEECRAANGNLADLTFIGTQPGVQVLLQRVASQKISVAELGQRYLPKYPSMQEAMKSLAQAEDELAKALDSAATSIRNEYESARRSAEQARADLKNQELEELKLGRYSVDYGTLENELTVNEQLLATIVSRMRETTMSASIESQNARIVDRASRPQKHSSPNLSLNLAIGAFVGLSLGMAIALVVAFLDDKLKNTFQIETVVGLPLIGIVPGLDKVKPTERARVVLGNSDPQAAEAFRSLHSNIRLKCDIEHTRTIGISSKNQQSGAKVMLVTSTTPGEGKSFVTSNLALTFAAHGERTIIVDCDLRRPNVHRSFGIPNDKGVVEYCSSGASLDSLIIKNHHAQLDILPAGGKASMPTLILGHRNFDKLIRELRERYDRILLDTPPLAPVSDALIILPHVDASIFTVRFNHVRTVAAKICARRLLETRIPCLGAVFNGLDATVGDYYYAEHYGKSSKDYLIADEAAVRT